MSYKSGHIYLIDHEPSNEELANFVKPVQFDVCKDGLFYSIIYDKNGNRYVEDRSKIITGFIKIGTIVREGNTIQIGVHPSGFNHWRINGNDVTSGNPITIELDPEEDLYRYDAIIGNQGGAIQILQGDAHQYPMPIDRLFYPNFAFFTDILITPESSIDPEILNNYVEKEEESWELIDTGSASNFVINYSDKKTRFKISSDNSIEKTLTAIIFSSETARAVEFWIYNNTGRNIIVPSSTTSGLTKGFTSLGLSFTIIPEAKALLKYNPETNLIECWKDNVIGGLTSVATDNTTISNNGTPGSPLKVSDTLKTEINNNTARTSSVTDLFLHYWDATAGKWLSSGLKFVAGTINQLEFAGRIKADAIILANNVNTAIANRFRSDGSRLYYANNSAVESTVAFTSDLLEHKIRGKVLTTSSVTGTYNCDLASYTRWVLTLTGNTTLAFTNMIAADETISISIRVTGNFTLTFPSWLKVSSDSDWPYDGTKVNRIFIEIENGGGSPAGFCSVRKSDS